MGKYRVCLVALAAAVVVSAGCARPTPVAPVSVPKVTEATPVPVPSAVDTPSQAAPPAQPVSSGKAPRPAIPPPPLLQEILDTGWRLSALKGLPPRNRPAEDNGEWEFVYSGGALRLFRDDKDSFYALVADHTHLSYHDFEDLTAGQSYVVSHKGRYTSVVRTAPLSEAVRVELASREWTQAELTTRLGKPTSRVHDHGVGTYSVTYVPQGLFFRELNTLKLLDFPAERIWREKAESLVASRLNTDEILEKGKPSPDGRMQAGYVQGGGYWSQWLVVREAGRIETQYHASYFIEDYFWLDNHRLVYAEVQVTTPYRFHVINVVTGQVLDPIDVDVEVKKFGPATSNTIWYEDKNGKRHEVAVP